MEVAGEKYVLFRDARGRPAALDDCCPHRRAPLSKGRVRPDGRLACAYHGWSFDGEGRGQSPACPTLRHCNTRPYQLIQSLGYLWIAAPETPISAFPALEQEGFEFAGSISMLFRAGIEVTLDNIGEDEHFAYVHSTFGWDEAGVSRVSVETTKCLDHTEVRYTGPQRASSWAMLGGVKAGDRFCNEWYTRFDPVHCVYTFWWQDPISQERRPIVTRAAVFLVPETRERTRAHMFLFLKIAPSLQGQLRGLFHWLARYIARKELQKDAELVAYVSEAPSTLEGMRLTRFDAALIHNRKLLQTLYWANGEQREPSSTPGTISSAGGRRVR